MWLPPEYALVGALVAVGAWFALRRAGRIFAGSTALEVAIVSVLYAAWRYLGEVTVASTAQAMERGRWIWDVQRSLKLPNEATLQRWALNSTPLIKSMNAYYIVCHVFPLGLFLGWMWFRRNEHYRVWRNVLGISSLVCIVIQWIPVAPPRMFPELGFIDAGAVYGPRVYDTAGAASAGQLAAMPSMHVAWAIVIGVGIWTSRRTRWGAIGPLHALLTIAAVTLPAYHWLADSLVAAALVLLAWVSIRGWRRQHEQVVHLR
jgi:PAP2 superfamily